jgi:hypothetical protein
MNRTIEIIIGTTGEIQIDAVGFKGPDREKATAFLEEALGAGPSDLWMEIPVGAGLNFLLDKERLWGCDGLG